MSIEEPGACISMLLNITDAIAVERQIKGWSRAKKEALIRGGFGQRHELAKRRG